MEEAKIGFFEKYLSLWVLLCIIAGVCIGYFFIDSIQFLSSFNYHQVNISIAMFIWLMIYPMMIQVDFNSLKDAAKDKKGLSLTVGINWLIKPFTMAILSYILFKYLFNTLISESDA
jgi:ACR3 family arsenite transporter